MKRALVGLAALAALPLFTGSAFAAGRLSDAQLDGVTAGQAPSLPAGLNCGGCTFAFSTSSSDNGVTTSTSGGGSLGNPSGGGSGGSGGGGSGSGSGGGSGAGGLGGGLQLPPAALAALIAGTVTTVVAR